MKTYINLLLLGGFLSSLTAASAAVTVVNNQPIYSGAFDVSQEAYNDGLDYDYTGGGSVEMWSNSGDVRAFLTAYQIYSDEMERMFEMHEYENARRVACPLNMDRTDNIAYLVVRDSRISIRNTDTNIVSSYIMSDIISGSDWNNNGKLDVYENVDGYRMSAGHDHVCSISYR